MAEIFISKKSSFDVQEIGYFGFSDIFAQFGGTYSSIQVLFNIVVVVTSAKYFFKKMHKI